MKQIMMSTQVGLVGVLVVGLCAYRTGLSEEKFTIMPNKKAHRHEGSGYVKADSIPAERGPARFGFGEPATPEHLAQLDQDIRTDGLGLPPGSGTVPQGAVIFAAKCAACHGVGGTGGPNGALVVTSPQPGKRTEKVIGNYWPYATTVFDYIRRAMPFNAPGSLTDDEVYALTAYLLSANKLVDEKTVGPSLRLNAKTLPAVQMPAQKLFVPDDRKGGPEIH